MNLYMIDVKIAGTMYVRADSEAEAQKIAEANKKEWIDHGGEYDLTEDGTVYLSPAMTMLGFFSEGAKIQIADDNGGDDALGPVVREA